MHIGPTRRATTALTLMLWPSTSMRTPQRSDCTGHPFTLQRSYQPACNLQLCTPSTGNSGSCTAQVRNDLQTLRGRPGFSIGYRFVRIIVAWLQMPSHTHEPADATCIPEQLPEARLAGKCSSLACSKPSAKSSLPDALWQCHLAWCELLEELHFSCRLQFYYHSLLTCSARDSVVCLRTGMIGQHVWLALPMKLLLRVPCLCSARDLERLRSTSIVSAIATSALRRKAWAFGAIGCTRLVGHLRNRSNKQ